MKACPFCAEEIQDAAILCRHCGADLIKGLPAAGRGAATIVVQRKELSAGVAAVLSLVIPGAGQMYCGHVLEGLFWLLLVIIGYAMLVLPGILLHIICIFGAVTSARKLNRQIDQQIAATLAPVAQTVAPANDPAPLPRKATQTETITGGALALLMNPRAVFRVGRPADRALVAIVYALAAIIVLRVLWLQAP